MEVLDPATGRTLPSDAIQRVLLIANKLHVYNIPPLTSMRGHNASGWTTDPSRHIFTARLRVIETSHDSSSSSSSSPNLKVDIVLEDPSTGQLFAACPYTDRTAVEPAVDSSRFFALTVRDEAGRKAVLGIGFEERPEAFDFAVALQEARKSLGWEGQPSVSGKEDAKTNEPARDYSLKEGETITVNLGSKFGRRRPQQEDHHQQQQQQQQQPSLQSFALAPPPPPSPSASSLSSRTGSAGSGSEGGGGFALPPPPSASDVKKKRRSLMEMGFDDGQFGEFA
jgi:hypothetical protein